MFQLTTEEYLTLHKKLISGHKKADKLTGFVAASADRKLFDLAIGVQREIVSTLAWIIEL